MPVDALQQRGAARDEVKLVPVALLDETFQSLGVANGGDQLLLPTAGDPCELPARRKKAASPLLVDHPRELVRAIHVGLVALEGPLSDLGDDGAAVLDAAVGAFADVEFHLQLEVAGRASAPNQERVLLDPLLRRAFPDDFPVLRAPELRIAVPARQGLAVENRGESGIVVHRVLPSLARTSPGASTRASSRQGGPEANEQLFLIQRAVLIGVEIHRPFLEDALELRHRRLAVLVRIDGGEEPGAGSTSEIASTTKGSAGHSGAA